MIPITFASSFGWFHEACGSCGVLLCAAQNHEDLCTHKGMRLMAEAFAAQGYSALRFDYTGTGDSLGSDFDPKRVEAWIASVEAAAAWMRTHAGVEKVVLVGLRLGSALATLAAERLGNISGLIMLAPVVSGRAYMRELSALSNLVAKPKDEQDNTNGNTEITGFVFTPETMKDISAIDLLSLARAPAPEVLLIASESQASAGRLEKSWITLGVHVERQAFDDYASFMIDPVFSQVPPAMLQHMLAWMATHFEPGSAGTAQKPIAFTPFEEECFYEFPTLFEEKRTLFGIMCVPKDVSYERPVIVYLNSGANHHIGWGRSTVEVCRKLAGLGFASLRIDITGLGDSKDPEPLLERILYRDESTQDVSAAINWLETQGFHNFTVVGLCAGAHLGFHSAVADARISRVVMVNLQKFVWHPGDSMVVAYREAYRSTGFYMKRLFEPGTWQRLLRGEIKTRGIFMAVSGRVQKKASASLTTIAHRLGRATSGEFGRVKGWMRSLDRRNVQQCYVLSVGDAGLDELSLYKRIKGTRVKGSPNVSLAFIDNADHNLSEHAARDVFMTILQDLLQRETAQKQKSAVRSAPRSFTFPATHL